MHGHVLEAAKSRLELVNNRINRVMHVGKYIYIKQTKLCKYNLKPTWLVKQIQLKL